MDRALDRQEQEHVRTARAHFFNTHKRSNEPPDSTPTSTTQPKAASETSLPSNKRFKMAHQQTALAEKANAYSKNQPIVRFYDPDVKARDAFARTQEQILSWTDSKLESSHNYIQVLFPLPEGSPFNSEAPVINLEVMQAFRSRRELRDRLRQSLERMLAFYGFKVSDKSEEELQQEQTEKKAAGLKYQATELVSPLLGSAAESFPPGSYTNVSAASGPRPYHILRAANWRKAFSNWTGSFDHNHLRISRIIRCLRVLGLQTEYEAFFKTLERVFNDPDPIIKISEQSFKYWRLAAMQPLHIAPDGKVCKWLKDWENEQENLKRSHEETLRNERDGVTKEKATGATSEKAGFT